MSTLGESYHSLVLFVLPLLKSSGKLLGLFVIIIVFVDIIISKDKDIKYRVYSLISFCLSCSTWSLFLKVKKVNVVFGIDKNTLINSISDLIEGKADSWRYDVIANYFRKLGEPSSFVNGLIDISFLSWIFVWLLMILALGFLENDLLDKKRHIVMFVSIVMEYLVYNVFLLGTFLFMFSEAEGIGLASFNRYIASFHMGVTIFLLVILWRKVFIHPNAKLFVISVLLFLINIVPLTQISKDVFYQEKSLEEGYSATTFFYVKDVENKYSDDIDETDNIAVLTETGSIWPYILRKAFIPAQTEVYNINTISQEYSNFHDFLYNNDFNKIYFFTINEESPVLQWEGISEDIKIRDGLYEINRDGTEICLSPL